MDGELSVTNCRWPRWRRTPSAAGPEPDGISAPKWDVDRNAYIQWDPELNEWMEFDEAAKQWVPISR